MDKEIEAIIAREAGEGAIEEDDSIDELIALEDEETDSYSEADAREEKIELENDSIDTLVDESQDVSTEGTDDGGWDHN
ncbi:hypothetical protein [Granulicella sp. S190]|uniref:hypothetical protein n=1 Tax=Granulicella sp. S190 TaxID=1747226 RepID=UPI00131C9778|nr:hypothetical protein [Granulicella sp. S190]